MSTFDHAALLATGRYREIAAGVSGWRRLPQADLLELLRKQLRPGETLVEESIIQRTGVDPFRPFTGPRRIGLYALARLS